MNQIGQTRKEKEKSNEISEKSDVHVYRGKSSNFYRTCVFEEARGVVCKLQIVVAPHLKFLKIALISKTLLNEHEYKRLHELSGRGKNIGTDECKRDIFRQVN
jgi:hypothetical protein